jgi:hypothetical protein
VADIAITLISKRKTTPNRIAHYQVINPVDAKEKDKYVYALLKEYHEGVLTIGNASAKMSFTLFSEGPI